MSQPRVSLIELNYPKNKNLFFEPWKGLQKGVGLVVKFQSAW